MDSVYRLPDEEKKAIDVGLKDITENKIYSSEAANNIIREWLKK